VSFVAGAPTRVRPARATIAPLGETLVSLGLIDEMRLAGALPRAQRAGLPLGRQLLVERAIDVPSLNDGLRAQLTTRLVALSEVADEGTYEFYVGVDLLARIDSSEAPIDTVHHDPLAVLLEVARRWKDDPRVDGALRRLGDSPIVLHPASDPARFALTASEAAALEAAREFELSYPSLLDAEVAPPEVVRTLVYVLAITRHLEVAGGGSWPIGVPKPDPRAARPVGAQDDGPPSSRRDPLSVKTTTTGAFRPSLIPQAAPQAESPRPIAVAARVLTPLPPATSPSVPAVTLRESPRDAEPDDPAPIALAIAPPIHTPAMAPPGPSPQSPRAMPSALFSTVTSGEPVPIMRPSASTPPPAPIALAEPLESPLRKSVLDRVQAMATQDHYEFLEVARDVPASEIQASFLRLAKTFHPDRLPAALNDVRDEAARVFGRAAEAHRTLMDAARRASYDAQLARGGATTDEHHEVAKVLQAATDHQKAEVMMKRGDLALAERFAASAAEGDPESSEYLSLLGWIRAQLTNDSASLLEPLKLLGTALQRDPKNDRALYYRGAVLKRLGQTAEAIRDFRAAAELNPKNVDAVREVRLHTMRTAGATSKKEPEKKGWLFKK
jgi:hypothetical protein